MFSAVFTDPNNALLKDRLVRVSEQLRSLVLPTAEEYQAAVYSAVNAVLSLGYAMSPLHPVAEEGPAVVGDASDNFRILNNDAEDIANELLRIEDSAASLFNLSATSQNQLRQQIRELIFAPNHQKYTEEFLNSNRLTSVTADLDFNAGVATNGLLDEVQVLPQIIVGDSSEGSLEAGTSFDNLLDSRLDTATIWNGGRLELVLSIPTQIVNRLKINLDEYSGLAIETLTTSPDGTLVEDVLVDLGVDRVLIDATSGKFSGDVTIDFPPRHATTIKLVLVDRVGIERIALRELSLYRRRYKSTGSLTTRPINDPYGTLTFNVQQNLFAPWTSVTHQISYDGTGFTAIKPGDVITLSSSPFYYRAVLERSSSKFDPAQGPVSASVLDPTQSSNYILAGTTTTPLGNGIVERTIIVNNVTGPIVLRDKPMDGTLQIQESAILLSMTGGDYSFANNIIAFPETVAGITITYQTTALGTAAIKDREEYYTPLLYGFSFTKVGVYTDTPAIVLGDLIPHVIHLTWPASEDVAVTSYNIYRSTTSGGPYTRIATMVIGLEYDDLQVVQGTKYYYVTTGISLAGESGFSNEIIEVAP